MARPKGAPLHTVAVTECEADGLSWVVRYCCLLGAGKESERLVAATPPTRRRTRQTVAASPADGLVYSITSCIYASNDEFFVDVIVNAIGGRVQKISDAKNLHFHHCLLAPDKCVHRDAIKSATAVRGGRGLSGRVVRNKRRGDRRK
jgi:hypothetical protein